MKGLHHEGLVDIDSLALSQDFVNKLLKSNANKQHFYQTNS